ncbi:hypothetical protein HYL88_004640 [Salmonella enterica subsp. enterica serovar Infantis]|uniref:hypothetical protein n=1 Tax=Salmonella enterica TaxID=28901 RepID=UPI00190D37BC|nr:hypothetical protein [Salmonella enterica]EFR5313980.1 hypothetical protein [Salmonella enterica subsp. enterica serovar Typhimurium]EFR5223085.1 hypothetical protein [Salmonella enterica subsp. enterica serovar Infantis]EFR5271533.1 hypothetical protein [Salmonella enterica subsp. enterica serovar Infantis]EFR5276547.1 hypothetical protein [Salmonella enterica subsp. enterica serovar Infantis]EFR5335948.1 hypothetical protein [Salmonella enterica subsp. enterica serovar Infantis]
MKIKCTKSNTMNLTVGAIYHMEDGVNGFSPTVTHEYGGHFFLNGKDGLSVNVGSFVLSEFEIVEE